jgi:hypothetical protein
LHRASIASKTFIIPTDAHYYKNHRMLKHLKFTEFYIHGTKEGDIPPPHYNHGTGNTPQPLDHTHW